MYIRTLPTVIEIVLTVIKHWLLIEHWCQVYGVYILYNVDTPTSGGLTGENMGTGKMKSIVPTINVIHGKIEIF